MSEPMVEGLPINYAGCPERFRDGMRRYLEVGIRPGFFLAAVIADQFFSAVVFADADVTIDDLRTIGAWMYNHAPSASFGSAEALNFWIAKRRTP